MYLSMKCVQRDIFFIYLNRYAGILWRCLSDIRVGSKWNVNENVLCVLKRKKKSCELVS